MAAAEAQPVSVGRRNQRKSINVSRLCLAHRLCRRVAASDYVGPELLNGALRSGTGVEGVWSGRETAQAAATKELL